MGVLIAIICCLVWGLTGAWSSYLFLMLIDMKEIKKRSGFTYEELMIRGMLLGPIGLLVVTYEIQKRDII